MGAAPWGSTKFYNKAEQGTRKKKTVLGKVRAGGRLREGEFVKEKG